MSAGESLAEHSGLWNKQITTEMYLNLSCYDVDSYGCGAKLAFLVIGCNLVTRNLGVLSEIIHLNGFSVSAFFC